MIGDRERLAAAEADCDRLEEAFDRLETAVANHKRDTIFPSDADNALYAERRAIMRELARDD